MTHLITNMVHVIIPDDHQAAQSVAMGDIAGKVEVVRLRKEFNTSVLNSLKDFAKNNGLDTEADFTSSSVNYAGFSVDCSERFEQAVKAVPIPYIGRFFKNAPLFNS